MSLRNAGRPLVTFNRLAVVFSRWCCCSQCPSWRLDTSSIFKYPFFSWASKNKLDALWTALQLQCDRWWFQKKKKIIMKKQIQTYCHEGTVSELCMKKVKERPHFARFHTFHKTSMHCSCPTVYVRRYPNEYMYCGTLNSTTLERCLRTKSKASKTTTNMTFQKKKKCLKHIVKKMKTYFPHNICTLPCR